MFPKIIKTEEEYTHAVSRIRKIMDAKPGTPECDELDLLVTLVELYEDEHYPIDPPDEISAIKFRMEQLDLHKGDRVRFNDNIRDLYVKSHGCTEIGKTGTVWNYNGISGDVWVKLDCDGQIIMRDVRCLDKI